MAKVDVIYYKLPIKSVPFSEIPSLENMHYEYVYCSAYHLWELVQLDLYLVSVYNEYRNDVKVNELEKCGLLFGEVLSDKLTHRGMFKCLKIGEVKKTILKEDLPHLCYSNEYDKLSKSNWFYMKDGNYQILKGIKSDFEQVKHLECITIYGDSLLRLRIVVEMLKKNIKNGMVSITEEKIREIAFKVLREDPLLFKASDDLIKDGIENWIPVMIKTPLYEDILPQDVGRVRI